MLILFQPACFSSSGSDHFNIRKFNSKFSQRRLFHPSQVVFFSCPPTFFLQGLRFLNHVSFYLREVFSLFSLDVLIRWFPMKMLNSFQFIILPSFFFSGGLISSFSVDHISSFCFTYLPMWILYPRLSYLFTSPSSYPECWRYLRRFVFSILNLFKLFGDYYLIQVI